MSFTAIPDDEVMEITEGDIVGAAGRGLEEDLDQDHFLLSDGDEEEDPLGVEVGDGTGSELDDFEDEEILSDYYDEGLNNLSSMGSPVQMTTLDLEYSPDGSSVEELGETCGGFSCEEVLDDEDEEEDEDDDRPIFVYDSRASSNNNSTIININTPASAKKEQSKEPTVVTIDTNSIMSGKGPIPIQKSTKTSTVPSNNFQGPLIPKLIAPKSDILLTKSAAASINIPDDAFLIEAPSFIIPYVFEQTGEKVLKSFVKDIAEEVKKEKTAANAGEDVEELPVPNKKLYFDTPIGKFFINLGMSLVQEYVQVDLLKLQCRKAEKERAKSRSGVPSVQTQQSIISLKNNIEESKENNEPFRFPMQKCKNCNFKTESELVLSTHLETPHVKNNCFRCNFCKYNTKLPHEILLHMEQDHQLLPRLEAGPALHQCPHCAFGENSKVKLTRHLVSCTKRFRMDKNLEPPLDWDTPGKLPKMPKNRLLNQGTFNTASAYVANQQQQQQQHQSQRSLLIPAASSNNQRSASRELPQNGLDGKSSKPNVSLPPLPRLTPAPAIASHSKPQGKTSFVICEICDGYIKDLDQLRNHMQWIHKLNIHPKMICNNPPVHCQKCEFRCFTDEGLERHLLGSHGLVTSSMQEAANKGEDNGRCPLCGKVYERNLLAHVAKDHNVTLKPADISYKCRVCRATYGSYRLFESHAYSAHSGNSKRGGGGSSNNSGNSAQTGTPPSKIGRGQLQVSSQAIDPPGSSQNSFIPSKINSSITVTVIPQPLANTT